MNLRDKTLIVTFPVLALTVATLYFMSKEIFLASFERIETETIDRDTRRARDELREMVADVDTLDVNWSQWDESYAFIEDGDTNYIASNLIGETLVGMRLNIIAYVHRSGRVVFATGFDFTNKQFYPLSEFATSCLGSNSPVFERCMKNEPVRGVLQLPEGLVFLAARPILTGAGQGPARGMLAMGRRLDADAITQLGLITHLHVNVAPLSDPQLAAELKQARAEMPGVERPTLDLNESTVAGFDVIDDILGRPAAILRVSESRDIDALGASTLKQVMVSLLLIGLVSAAVMTWLLQVLVLKRLGRLSGDVAGLGAHGALSERLEVTGDDELSTVGHTINRMLESLDAVQKRLREHDERYRRFVETAPDIIFSIAEDGNFIALNPAFEKITGWPYLDWIGRPFMGFVHPHDAEYAMRKFRESLNSAEPVFATVRVRAKSGDYLLMDVTSRSLLEDGHSAGAQGIARDVTERRRAEERLRVLATGMHGVVEAADELIGCATIDDLYRRAVELAREKLSVERCCCFIFDRESARGTFGTDMDGRTTDERANSFRIEPEWERNYAAVRPEKSRWVLKEDSEHWNWDGQHARVVGRGWVSYTAIARPGARAIALFIHDAAISETPFDPVKQEIIAVYCSLLAEIIIQKRSDEALRESESRFRALNESLEQRVEERTRAAVAANRAKSQFLAGVSHELRTPLNAIVGFSELLAEKQFGALNERQQRYVQNIASGGQHLLQLINDILDLSKIDAGRIVLAPSLCDPRQIIQDALMVVATMANKKSIAIETNCAPNLPAVRLDEAKFRQIMYNLLSNAVKFTREGGRVTVGAEMVRVRDANGTSRPCLRVAVADTGIGVKPQDQQRIFDEFVQVDSGYARGQEGTGLGLSLVRKLVELHAGHVRIESEGVEGKGSTFTVEIPAQESGDAPAAPVNPRLEGDGALLLLIDDEPTMIGIMTEAIRKAGFRAIHAANGREGVGRALEHKPRAIVVDMVMPGISGVELIQELRSLPETKNTPIVVFTGHELPAAQAQQLMSHVHAIVYKPDIEELLRVVSRFARSPL